MANGNHSLVKLLSSSGTWNAFETDWKKQCEEFDEDFEQYGTASLPVLRDEVSSPSRDTGVYALQSDSGAFDAVIHAKSSFIPKFEGKVLRARHLLLSPTFDFGDYAITDYSRVLARIVARTIGLAIGDLPSRHVKFHLRSPADRDFFAAFGETIAEVESFYDVAIRGSWLHMSIRQRHVDTGGH